MIEASISIATGLYLTLAGFRIVPIGKDTIETQKYLDRFGTLWKFGGPLVLIWGIIKFLERL